MELPLGPLLDGQNAPDLGMRQSVSVRKVRTSGVSPALSGLLLEGEEQLGGPQFREKLGRFALPPPLNVCFRDVRLE